MPDVPELSDLDLIANRRREQRFRMIERLNPRRNSRVVVNPSPQISRRASTRLGGMDSRFLERLRNRNDLTRQQRRASLPPMSNRSAASNLVTEPAVRSRIARVRHSITTNLAATWRELNNSSSNVSVQPTRPRTADRDHDGRLEITTRGSNSSSESGELATWESPSRRHLMRSSHAPRPPRYFSDDRNSSRASTQDGPTHQQSTSFGDAQLRPGEDQAAMLSRLLSVAASATAASLVGNSSEQSEPPAPSNNDSLLDGSFESFLRALQNGRLAAALRNGGRELTGTSASTSETMEGDLPPLNFFRMFRFASSTQQIEGQQGAQRMVPIIIVGIRSVPPRDSNGPVANDTPLFFDALANLPIQRSNSQRVRPVRGNPTSTQVSSPSVSSVASNSSPLRAIPRVRGPQPPPLPNQSFPSDMLGVNSDYWESPASTPEGESTDDEFADAPEFAISSPEESQVSLSESGIPWDPHAPAPPALPVTTNDTNFPPQGPPPQSPIPPVPFGRSPPVFRPSGLINDQTTRSWIIYVLGGAYPENHPILTTPSLFTDSPTYEDMLLLSSLIGQAKPPVASAEEVSAAGGITIVGNSDSVVHENDRCQVCLSDYEAGEQVRRLGKCSHYFHRECIDEWLTTGRNSCPLCRNIGVQQINRDEQAGAV
ncbi:putative RING finger protein [Neolecta irregularis DAH-3]|uniref:Putative RING finger protein n=1 Tax=Neolecta irregularis (strain DAH-3) TaxID=1198029 RepID=A0A1U7LGF2_NEOID|nr:putative RING finger protein [Neolecta irregularis DAH-3]|eukprot:OLL21735.1 putative RING finger protein [Neolecta irregularis DAH-3]